MRRFLVLFFLFWVSSGLVFAKDMRFVQVSDVRFSAGDENNSLERLVNEINKQNGIEFVVFTGDNIANPRISDLDEFLNNAKKLDVPFYIVIGDKDVNKHKKLSKVDYLKVLKKQVKKYSPENTNYVFEKNGTVFIVLDGAKDVIPSTNGYYKDETLTWLNAQLNLYSKKNVIIFQHFPIIPPTEKETYYTYKPEKYMAILAQHSNVKAIISGHFGVNKDIVINGINHISTAGLPYYRVIDILDYDTKNPTIWAELKEIK